MKSLSAYFLRVVSAGAAALVTFQIATIFPAQDAGKYFSFLGFVYILASFLKMGQAFRFLKDTALDENKFLNPILFLTESGVLTFVLTIFSYLVLKIVELALAGIILFPENYMNYLIVSAFLLSLIFSNAEYKKIIGDSLGFVLYGNFLISITNLCVFSWLYFLIDDRKFTHAIQGLIISLMIAVVISMIFFSYRKKSGPQKLSHLAYLSHTILQNAKNGLIFMWYELSEHLQAWAVPIVFTLIGEFGLITEYRLAFRLLALISFVPLIINSHYAQKMGKFIQSDDQDNLKYLLLKIIRKTGIGIIIAALVAYLSCIVIQFYMFQDKYENLLWILMVLSFGFSIYSLFEFSTIILNLGNDRRMIPFFFNIGIFSLILLNGLTAYQKSHPFLAIYVFSFALAIKGMVQFFLLKRRLNHHAS